MKNSLLIKLESVNDLPLQYQNSPIADLVAYHNLNFKYKEYESAALLALMCMDHRKALQVPKNFCYIMRDGGANLKASMFKVSFALSVGGVRHIAIIGHNNCGMVDLHNKKDSFIEGLVALGWNKEKAKDHFNTYAPEFEIGSEVNFTLSEAKRLRKEYPSVIVAPFLYKVEDSKLYLIREA